MIPQLIPAQHFLIVQILLDPFHLLLSTLSLTPQKESLPCLLPLAIPPMTILPVTVLLFTTFLLLSHPLFLFSCLLKLSLLSFLLLLLILITLLPTFPFLLVLFSQPGPIVFPGSPPDYHYFRTTLSGSDSAFSNTAPYLPILLDFNPPLGLVLSGVVAEIPGVPFLGGEELPEAEDIESLPPPAVRPLLSPAIFGLIINQV